MLQAITQLLQLQERDQRIRQFQKELKDIPKHEAMAKTQLAGDQQAVEMATHKVKEIEVKIKSIELDIQTRQNTIKRLGDQQFETRKNDEFQALGHEIERYKAEVTKLEDAELEQMEALEAAKDLLKQAQARLAQTQGRVNEELQQLAARAEGIRKRLADTEAERKELAAPIDPGALGLYNRLFSKKPDAAVAPLGGGICGGCHMKVVLGTIQQVKTAEAITQCDSCGRILYLAE